MVNNALSKKRFHAVYLVSVLYVILTYLYPVLFVWLWYTNPHSTDLYMLSYELNFRNVLTFLPLLVPCILFWVNLVVAVTNRKKPSDVFYTMNVIMKYGLIPFYLIGGCIIALLIMLIISPVIIMIFVTPPAVTILTIIGYLSLIGTLPVGLASIIKGCKDKLIHPALGVFYGIAQFFFGFDVLSTMGMSLNFKKHRKLSLVLLILLIIFTILAILVLVLWAGIVITLIAEFVNRAG